MASLCGLVMLSGAYPLWRAWRAVGFTSLRYALLWAAAAWAVWVVSLAGVGPVALRYLALALAGCAGIAVLGARRPGAAAWNFVVAGLLAVLLLPLAEGGGRLHLSPPRLVFLAGALAVGLVNYLPTRLAPAALLFGAGCAAEVAALTADEYAGYAVGPWAVAAAPWAARLCLRRGRVAANEFDRLWLDFRDRFGFVWGQRVREQFNRSASHAGWPAELGWFGLERAAGAALSAETESEMFEALRALLKRFV